MRVRSMELSAAEAKLLGLLEEGAKRPVGRHTRYRFAGATQEGDALVVFRASPKRAIEALTLAAMVESMPLGAAVRCCALIACIPLPNSPSSWSSSPLSSNSVAPTGACASL